MSNNTKGSVLRKSRDLGIAVQDQIALQKLVELVNFQDDQQAALKQIFTLILQGGYRKLSQECVQYVIEKVENNFAENNLEGDNFNVQKKQKLEIVDLKSVQRVAFDPVQKRFIPDPSFAKDTSSNIFAYPQSEAFKNRYLIFQQWIKRSGMFKSSTVLTEQDNKSRLYEIKGLIGCFNQRRLTYGMLSCPCEGQVELIDPTGSLQLDVSNVHSTSPGFFTENMMVIVEGSLRVDQKFHVVSMVMPPIESRESAQHVLRGLNTFGGTQPRIIENFEEEEGEQFQSDNTPRETAYVVILNNVLLSKQQNVEQLHTLLQSYENRRNEAGELNLPEAFILIGDFLCTDRQLNRRLTDVEKHYDFKEILETVARIFDQYSNIKKACQILVIPSQNDYCGIPKLPQLPLPQTLNQTNANIIICGNPCRWSRKF
eukprot:TRINITY_DN44837_c0_g1_i1.p1 TRINITY_DN44837_c0_g1~~TRINITY_DN44837_c0_g1_i1.p1  ORF type:complete len:441 (+),score=35.67 TRINITY_DN44837_c0_g1_i1:41-1324(+)